MSDNYCDIPGPPPEIYQPSGIILYGTKLNTSNSYGSVAIGDTDEIRIQLFHGIGQITAPSGSYSIVAAHGYSYDGHCYRFDSVRLFVVTGPIDQDPIGCGFDLAPEIAGWRMWRLTSTMQLVEFTVASDYAQTLILDNSLPGKRAPNTYAVGMQLAHRGRLSRE